MYLDHFGLRTDPFPLYPSLKFVFMSTPFEEAMAHLAYGLEQEEDIIMISGPIGTGKTLAVQSLLANLAKLYRTAFVNVTQLDYVELMKLVLADLGTPLTGSVDRADLLTAFKEQVRQSRARGQKILIVVDEAQNLAPDTLEGLRLLTNVGQPEGQAVQLVLVGQPDLERKVRLPQLVQLQQRIRVHYRLETLDRKETEAYIAHRLKVAGVERPLFRPKAIDLIHRASCGVPRLVNILCSRALLSAFVAGRSEVDPDHVDLEDLPPAAGVQEAAAAIAAPVAARAAARVEAPAPNPARAPTPAPAAAVPAPAPEPALAPGPKPAPPPAAAPAAAPPAPAAAAPRRAAPKAASAQPFEPMAAYRRRNQRSGAFFVVAIVLLVIAIVIVFSLQPAQNATQWPWHQAGSGDSGAPADAGRSALPENPGPVEGAGPGVAQAAQWPPEATASDAAEPAGATLGQDFPTGDRDAMTPIVAQPAVPMPPVSAVEVAAAPARPAAPAPRDVDDTPRAHVAGDSLPVLPKTAGAPGGWAVHVHSFQAQDRTDADVGTLRSAGYPAFFRTAEVEGVAWWRVYVGPYATLADAQEVADRLRGAGVSTYAQIVKLGDAGR